LQREYWAFIILQILKHKTYVKQPNRLNLITHVYRLHKVTANLDSLQISLSYISYPDIRVKHCAYGLSVAIFTKRQHLSIFSFGRSKIIHSVQKYKLNLKKSPLKKRASIRTCLLYFGYHSSALQITTCTSHATVIVAVLSTVHYPANYKIKIYYIG
jgi:hypothetical protein